MNSLFSLPISAGPADYAWGSDELGNPLMRTVSGQGYTFQPQASEDRQNALAMMYAAQNGEQYIPGWTGQTGAVNPLVQMWEGFKQGVTAPGRALSGEPVTYGDAWASALDWGAMGAPIPKPKGALLATGDYRFWERPGQNRYRKPPPYKTGWTFKDMDTSLNARLSGAENRRIDGDTARIETVPIRELYAMQPEVADNFATTTSSAGELPLVVRKDGKMFVRDGHHRLVKASEEGAQSAKVRFIDLDNADTSTPLLDYEPSKWTAEDEVLLRELLGK